MIFYLIESYSTVRDKHWGGIKIAARLF